MRQEPKQPRTKTECDRRSKVIQSPKWGVGSSQDWQEHLSISVELETRLEQYNRAIMWS